MVLIAVDRAFGAASVGNEDEVILGENDAFLDAVYFALDGFCDDLDMILETCSRVILMSGGCIVCDGDAKEILTNQELLEENGLELPFCLQKPVW